MHDPRDRGDRGRTDIVLADFTNETPDTLLGPGLERALRIDLGQSPVVAVVDPARVATTLERMKVAPETELDLALAREIAFREGIGAVLAPVISRVGTGYVLSAELYSREGELLLSLRESAADSTEILIGLDRLSKGLRERIGEPLKSIARSPYVYVGTTSNLEALAKFSAAGGVWENLHPDSIKLLEEALALDSTFALAWSVYGVTQLGMGERARGLEALTRAFELRDQSSEAEQQFLALMYWWHVRGEKDKAAEAAERMLELLGPDDTTMGYIAALNTLGNYYRELGQFARAEVTLLEGLRRDSLRTGVMSRYSGAQRGTLAMMQTNLGKYEEARATLLAPVAGLESEEKQMPIHVNRYLADVASAAGDYETAEQHYEALREGEDPRREAQAKNGLAALAALRGRLAEARELKLGALEFFAENGLGAPYLSTTLQLGGWTLFVEGDTAEALASVEAALARFPWSDLPIDGRPSDSLAEFLAAAGEADRARAILEEHEQEQPPEGDDPDLHHLERGEIALAQRDYEEAIERFQQADAAWVHSCLICALPGLARAYERAGDADSAISNYERYVTTPSIFRQFQDQYYLGPTHERLGQLYEERGDRENALRHYAKFVELWRDADPELQPRVRAAQVRVEEILEELG